jgi:siroheme synthase-like protein
MANKYMPIGMAMKERKCLVVGGGKIALRKIETLMEYTSDITIIAPEITEKIDFYGQQNIVGVIKRAYESPEASQYGLVISASDDEAVNQAVYADAHSAGVAVNVVDSPKQCDFIFPAVVHRDCLSMAISTDGQAPFMSSHLKIILDTIFPKHWNRLMKLATEFRKLAKKQHPDDPIKRGQAFERFVNADWKTMLKEMSKDELNHELNSMLEN